MFDMMLTGLKQHFKVKWQREATLEGSVEERHRPLGEGELDCVLDEAVATRTDDKGGSCLDAVLQHHVCCNPTCMKCNLHWNKQKHNLQCV